jgi:hypothetical protein
MSFITSSTLACPAVTVSGINGFCALATETIDIIEKIDRIDFIDIIL